LPSPRARVAARRGGARRAQGRAASSARAALRAGATFGPVGRSATAPAGLLPLAFLLLVLRAGVGFVGELGRLLRRRRRLRGRLLLAALELDLRALDDELELLAAALERV